MFAIMSALCICLLPGTVMAAPPDPSERHGRIVSEIILQPEPDSDIIVDGMRAIVWEDGAVSVRGRGSGIPGQLQSFSFQIDLESQTYSTTLLASESVVPDDGASLMASDYVARVNVVTEDEFQIDVAETLHRLQWTVSGGAVTWGYGQVGCWEKNPTLAGTHWFEDFCSRSSLSISTFQAAQSSFGRYYNYDFYDDAQSTWTEHTIQLYGYYTGGFNFDWDVTFWGEFSYLLQGDVTSCGCY